MLADLTLIEICLVVAVVVGVVDVTGEAFFLRGTAVLIFVVFTNVVVVVVVVVAVVVAVCCNGSVESGTSLESSTPHWTVATIGTYSRTICSPAACTVLGASSSASTTCSACTLQWQPGIVYKAGAEFLNAAT
jgi:hypothetical protein